jgi:hypothetical protein
VLGTTDFTIRNLPQMASRVLSTPANLEMPSSLKESSFMETKLPKIQSRDQRSEVNSENSIETSNKNVLKRHKRRNLKTKKNEVSKDSESIKYNLETGKWEVPSFSTVRSN